MSKVRNILCIYPEPPELRIAAMLNRLGMAVDLTEVALAEKVKSSLEQAHWWDLVLCDVTACDDLDLPALLDAVRGRFDASLILLRSAEQPYSHPEGFLRGAVDVVVRDDTDHLIMVCQREFKHCDLRRRLRELQNLPFAFESDSKSPVMVATVDHLSKMVEKRRLDRRSSESSAEVSGPAHPLGPARVKALIDAGGLTLEYQPIVSFKRDERQRNTFETLVRLKDESGHLLLPEAFLPAVSEAGWMGRVDLWIFRHALAVLEEMQSEGVCDATFFINLASESLRCEQTVRAIGAFVSAAHLSPGSIVIEVHKSVFDESPEALRQLVGMLRLKRHSVLLEDLELEDCDFLRDQRDTISHVKLSSKIIHALVGGVASQSALAHFVRCAHKGNIRVVALAVDSLDLMPMLFAAGVDAIQGDSVCMPSEAILYPSVQRIDSPTLSVHPGRLESSE